MEKNMQHKLLVIIFISLLTQMTNALASDRPSLITENFFASQKDQPLYDTRSNRWSSNQSGNLAMLWHKALISLDINAPPPSTNQWRNNDCGFKHALDTLNAIKTDHQNNASYVKLWANNQNKVFSVCDTRSIRDKPPTRPKISNLPERAQSDFLYQLGSWHFYKREFKDALALYERLAAKNERNTSAFAAYMTVRTLAKMGRKSEAYYRIDSILASENFKDVHGISANYRFVLMYYRSDMTSNSINKKHLEWLTELISQEAQTTKNITQYVSNYYDAREQIDKYFPRLDPKSGRIDWWLDKDLDITTPRMNAVRTLAPDVELIDWLQSSWAENVFDHSWLLALHATKATYWRDNQNIVNHAWKRWENGDGLEWLEIAIERVHPKDKLAPKILHQASVFLERPWKEESREYKSWLFKIWEHSLRLNLGLKQYDQGYKIIENHPDFEFLKDNRRYVQNTSHKYSLGSAIKWLIYTGEFGQARLFLDLATKQHPHSYIHLRILLAKSWEEATLSLENGSYGGVYNTPFLWEKMVNFLPANKLLELTHYKLNKEYKAILTSAAFTRVILLEQYDDMDRFSIAAADNNLDMRNQILKTTSKNKSIDYVSLMLKTPRLRPIPFTLYSINREEKSPFKIDVFNHNDNNWWCRVRVNELESMLNKSAIITAPRTRVLGHISIENQKKYTDLQEDFLSKHPFRSLVNNDELRKLELIPHAPQYLSEQVINHLSIRKWLPFRNRNEAAANLHYSVRTTRFGCNRDGSHAAYSREAYRILQKHYSDSLWAKKTPYWFK